MTKTKLPVGRFLKGGKRGRVYDFALAVDLYRPARALLPDQNIEALKAVVG